MTLILGHRGLSASHLENSLEAFRAALEAGMDGFEVDVQPTLDGVCVALHDADLARTAREGGVLRRLKSTALPLLQNGEPLPRLSELLELPAKQALAAVEAAGALSRVLFSSFEPSEVLQLWAECPEARCGFLWEAGEAMELTEEELADLPEALMLHVPLRAVQERPAFWKPYAKRLVLWEMARPENAKDLGFAPAALIVDGL